MGIAGGAQSVADGHLGDASAIETGQRRDEAVQLAIKLDVFQHLGAIGFEGGAEIAQVHTGWYVSSIGDPALKYSSARSTSVLLDFPGVFFRVANWEGRIMGRPLPSINVIDRMRPRY